MAAKILVALLDERQDYSQLQKKQALAAAERASLSIDVVYAANDPVLQIHQLFPRIHAPEGERPVAMAVHSVTGEGQERAARNAVAAGIGWFLLNRRVPYVDELRATHPDLPIGRVSLDQVEIGRIQGRQTRALVPGGGLLLYVSGPPDTSAALERLRGTEEVLSGDAFEWKVLNGHQTEAAAEAAVGGWLRLRTHLNQRPAIIVAQNDSMAMGARQAGVAYDPAWRNVPVVGCDGLPQHGQALVKSGRLAATVVTPASAGPAVDLLAKWLRDRQPPPGEMLLPSQSYPAEWELRPAPGAGHNPR